MIADTIVWSIIYTLTAIAVVRYGLVVLAVGSFVANSLPAFVEGLKQVSVHSIHHHFIEARLRLKLMSNDFSQWLAEDMGLTEAARALNRVDIYTATMEGVRQQIVKIVERSMT